MQAVDRAALMNLLLDVHTLKVTLVDADQAFKCDSLVIVLARDYLLHRSVEVAHKERDEYLADDL